MVLEDLEIHASKKLAFNFVEEAGIRCFETGEFPDWFEAIHAVLNESGVVCPVEVVREIFNAIPDSVDEEADEAFELTLIVYLIHNKLLARHQVEGPEWEAVFSKEEQVQWVDESALRSLHQDSHLRVRFEEVRQNLSQDRSDQPSV